MANCYVKSRFYTLIDVFDRSVQRTAGATTPGEDLSREAVLLMRRFSCRPTSGMLGSRSPLFTECAYIGHNISRHCSRP
jgi:hypothetical protein